MKLSPESEMGFAVQRYRNFMLIQTYFLILVSQSMWIWNEVRMVEIL